MFDSDIYSSPIVIFDIDGTLTKHRQKIDDSTIKALLEIAGDVQLGFVTGSPFSLIEEQMAPFFNVDNARIAENVDIFPCNGTQYFYWDACDNKFMCSRSVSMRDHLGEQCFRKLILAVQEAQNKFVGEFALKFNIPLCGNFIDYRDSLLNWCPIGRAATFNDRKIFIGHDERSQIRDTLKRELDGAISDIKGIVINYGGETSFDIFPAGWDKTFCLNTYPNATVWFVGDQCQPGGNDYEIFSHLRPMGRAFSVRSPKETIKVIRTKIAPAIKEFIETCD